MENVGGVLVHTRKSRGCRLVAGEGGRTAPLFCLAARGTEKGCRRGLGK